MKPTIVAPDTRFSKGIFGLGGVSLLYIGLRIYCDFSLTGTEDIAKMVVEQFPQQSQWQIYWIVSVMLRLPFIATNALAVGLVLGLFFRHKLWRYGLAVGFLSEVGWVLVYCGYIWDHSVSVANPAVLMQELIGILSPAVAAYGVEKICGIRAKVQK